MKHKENKMFIKSLIIGAIFVISATGCAGSRSFKQDTLVCVGFCSTVENSVETETPEQKITNKGRNK